MRVNPIPSGPERVGAVWEARPSEPQCSGLRRKLPGFVAAIRLLRGTATHPLHGACRGQKFFFQGLEKSWGSPIFLSVKQTRHSRCVFRFVCHRLGRRTGAREPVRLLAVIEEIATMSDFLFGPNLFEEFDRLHRQTASVFSGLPSSIRAAHSGAYPQINIGSTDNSVEIVVCAPGVDPSKVEVTVDKGLLTISGERQRPPLPEEARPYAQERFAGSFRRAVELPRDADPVHVQARYVNGCLSISVGKRETSKPRTIAIQ
jgi:HSP20 family protein